MKLLRSSIDFDTLFDEIIKSDSSPGMPYMNVKRTNDKLLTTEYREYIKDLVADRLHKLMNLRCVETYDPKDAKLAIAKKMGFTEWSPHVLRYMMDNNYLDPVRLFVKKEPHTQVKLSENRIRLISSVSIVDQIVERLLRGSINNFEIKEWQVIPSLPGIGLTTDDDFRIIASRIAKIADPAQTDVIGWDWSMQYWELLADAVIASSMYKYFTDELHSALLSRAFFTAESIYSTSDGELFSLPLDDGIQLSGSYFTSSTNSRCRILAHILVHGRYKKAIAMGDDCIDQYNETLFEDYARLGHPLKFADRCTNQIEFCSHVIEVTSDGDYLRHYPSNLGKQLFNLLNQPKHLVTKETLRQFLDPYRYHPERYTLLNHLEEDEVWGDLTTQYRARLSPSE